MFKLAKKYINVIQIPELLFFLQLEKLNFIYDYVDSVISMIMLIDSVDCDYLFFQYAIHSHAPFPPSFLLLLLCSSQRMYLDGMVGVGVDRFNGWAWMTVERMGFACMSTCIHRHTNTQRHPHGHTLSVLQRTSQHFEMVATAPCLTFREIDYALLTEYLRILQFPQYGVTLYVLNFNSKPKSVSG